MTMAMTTMVMIMRRVTMTTMVMIMRVRRMLVLVVAGVVVTTRNKYNYIKLHAKPIAPSKCAVLS